MTSQTRKNGTNTADGRFAPGNPGRPKGARHRVTRAVEALLEGQAEALTQKALDAAMAGDGIALRLCLERIVPARRERLVQFQMPRVKSMAHVPSALTALLNAVANGQLTPGEANGIGALLDRYVKAYELVQLEARISQLEAGQAVRGDSS